MAPAVGNMLNACNKSYFEREEARHDSETSPPKDSARRYAERWQRRVYCGGSRRVCRNILHLRTGRIGIGLDGTERKEIGQNLYV